MKQLQPLNVFVSIAAFVLAASQLLFVFNFIWSFFRGPKAEKNPWKANTLEWTVTAPIPHGNWTGPLPTVYRWPYDYALTQAPDDYIPQNTPASYIGG
jgi:cytochrome c oxidase subunit 1